MRPVVMCAVAAGALLLAAGESQARQANPAPVRVAVVVIENKSPEQVLRRGWLAQQARAGGRALNAVAEVNPSLGNYLAMISGSTQGVHDDDVRHGPFGARTIVRQLERAGVSWRAYMNDMPEPCFGRESDDDETGLYAKRHNPFMFFTEVVNYPNFCREHVVPGNRLAADMTAGLPGFVWISPDLCQDMHDCSVAQGLHWMERTLPTLMEALGPRGVLFVTADEEHYGDRIPLVAMGSGVRPHSVMRQRVNHRNLLATIEDLLGLGRLPTTRFDATLKPLLITSQPVR